MGQIGGAGGPSLVQTMGSPARMYGAELEMLYQLTSADRFGLNVSYNKGYYVDKPAAFASGVANSDMAGVVPWTVDANYSHMFSLPKDQN